jgi:transcriptional regulator with XRE-family HTH domain
MTPAQCKAARALAGINAMDLAIRSGIDSAVLHEFESGVSQPKAEVIDAITFAFDSIGIVFITRDATSSAGGEGVRLKAPENKSFDVTEREVVQYPEFLENDAPPGAGG